MKNIGDVFEVVENVLPSDASKTIMYCEVENKSYEIFYYSYVKATDFFPITDGIACP